MKIILNENELNTIKDTIRIIKEEVYKINETPVDTKEYDELESFINGFIQISEDEFIFDINSNIIELGISLYTNIYVKSLPLMYKIDKFITKLLDKNNPTLSILKSMIMPILPEGIIEEATEYIKYTQNEMYLYKEKCNSFLYPNE